MCARLKRTLHSTVSRTIMQENNSIIIAMLEELLTISKSQRPEQTINANVDLIPVKELIENGIRENKGVL